MRAKGWNLGVLAASSLLAAILTGGVASTLAVPPFFAGLVTALTLFILPCGVLIQAMRERQGGLTFTQAALERAAAPFLIVDDRFRVIHINRAFRRLSGLPERSSTLETLPKEWVDLLVPQMREAFSDRHPAYVESWLHRRDGRAVFVRLNCVQAEDFFGRHYAIAHFDDLTARENENAQLLQRSERAATFLQRLIDVIPNPVYVKYADGRLALVNEAYAAEWGVERGKLLGHTVMELAPDNPRAAVAAVEDEQVVKTGRRVHKEECTPQWTSGMSRWRIISKGSCLDAEGNTVIVGANFDITEQRELERNLQQALNIQTRTRAFLQATFNALPNPVSVKDQQLHLIMTNEAWRKTFGMTLADMDGNSIVDVVARDGTQVALADAERKLLAGPDGTVWESELSIRREDGAVQRFILRETVTSDMAEGHALLCVYSDVSTIKNAEEESIRAREAAERANEAKSLFLANMSHELRTPMHAVMSFARLGEEKTASQQPCQNRCHNYFERISVAGERLMALLNDLLDLSKLESGRVDIELNEVDLVQVVEDALSEFSAVFSRRRQQVIRHLEEVARPRGDAIRLGQVVRNLLSNASKFSPDGGEIEIALRGTPGNSQVELIVADSGVGIPEQELESVFDKFVQSSLTRTGAGGTGLGLAICREIVDLHGGEIFARNRPGSGAELVVRLPVGDD